MNKVEPSIKVITTKARNIKKIIFAIEAAPAAIPVNPNMDAMIAMTKKISVHFNIVVCFRVITHG